MSLRYMGRVLYQGGMRVVQGMKDHGSKCDSTIRSLNNLKDSSSKQARRFSSCFDSPAFKSSCTNSDKLKQAEDSLRTVMFLSCWGPN